MPGRWEKNSMQSTQHKYKKDSRFKKKESRKSSSFVIIISNEVQFNIQKVDGWWGRSITKMKTKFYRNCVVLLCDWWMRLISQTEISSLHWHFADTDAPLASAFNLKKREEFCYLCLLACLRVLLGEVDLLNKIQKQLVVVVVKKVRNVRKLISFFNSMNFLSCISHNSSLKH